MLLLGLLLQFTDEAIQAVQLVRVADALGGPVHELLQHGASGCLHLGRAVIGSDFKNPNKVARAGTESQLAIGAKVAATLKQRHQVVSQV